MSAEATLQYTEQERDEVEARLNTKELDYRVSHGIEIFLYWHRKTNTLSGCIIDPRGPQTLVFPVPNDKGNTYMQHPYLFAQGDGVVAREAIPVKEVSDGA